VVLHAGRRGQGPRGAGRPARQRQLRLPRENRYVSVSGTATLVRDRGTIERLWDQLYRAWFPQGVDDPELALLRVRVERAEYWDAPQSTMAEIAGFVPGLAADTPDEAGEHVRIDRPAGRTETQPPGKPPEAEPAVERGERIATGKAIARGGKARGKVPGATEHKR